MAVKPRWSKYLPGIKLYLSFPFIQFQTELFSESAEFLAIIWMSLSWQIWKWKGRFLLYRDQVSFSSSPSLTDKELEWIDNEGCWISKEHRLRHYCKAHDPYDKR